jgi:hypothetical protein
MFTVRRTNSRVVIFGDRSGTWTTEADTGEWAGLEEPFAVLHKTTHHTLIEERHRDAAPNPKPRRTPSEVYQRVQARVQRVVQLRWDSALAAQRHDDGAAIARFRKLWEAPGFVAIDASSNVTVLLLMRAETRARWRRQAPSARIFRSQQHAPPTPAPANMAQIFTHGAGLPRQKNKPPPPAGFGVAVYDNGQLVTSISGQIIARVTPHVRTTTENLGHLVAFARAVEFAAANFRDRPVCIRYSAEYAARISTGAWKAKKHKEVALAARLAWKRLKTITNGQAWMLHDPARNGVAKDLATRGMEGENDRTDYPIVAD